jgi:hypothetical protein
MYDGDLEEAKYRFIAGILGIQDAVDSAMQAADQAAAALNDVLLVFREAYFSDIILLKRAALPWRLFLLSRFYRNTCSPTSPLLKKFVL